LNLPPALKEFFPGHRSPGERVVEGHETTSVEIVEAEAVPK
jgi:hypothetical protein